MLFYYGFWLLDPTHPHTLSKCSKQNVKYTVFLEVNYSQIKGVYVTVPEKTDHPAQISDVKILVPRCSTLFNLRNGEVRHVS